MHVDLQMHISFCRYVTKPCPPASAEKNEICQKREMRMLRLILIVYYDNTAMVGEKKTLEMLMMMMMRMAV